MKKTSSSPTLRLELEQLRQKITELVTAQPAKAVTILTDWLKKPAQKSPSKKAA